MKTEKLINGKTFDEIFGQRGERISIDSAIVGDLYLLPYTPRTEPWNWLSIFAGFNDDLKHPNSTMGTIHDLCSDGDTFLIDDTDISRGFAKEHFPFVFKATPDQVALHELYVKHEN